MMQADGLILAGGKSRRMGGIHKGSLTYGNKTFTQILVKELKREAQKVWLSYGQEVKEQIAGCGIVRDIYEGSGPIGGLHAGLKICANDWLLVAACDMPFLKAELFRYLYQELLRGAGANLAASGNRNIQSSRYDGVVPVTNGNLHPLVAIYGKSSVRVLEEQIKDRNYRLCDALLRLDILYVDMTGKKDIEWMLQNINTRQEYETATIRF